VTLATAKGSDRGATVRPTSLVLAAARERFRASPLLEHYAQQERLESRELLGDVLGGPSELPKTITRDEELAFDALIRRRLAGESVAAIRGYEDFMGMRLDLAPGVFVPRESSTLLAETAVRRLRRRTGPTAVDVATGAGPIALAIARAVPRARVFGTDISPDAIRAARANDRRHRLGVRFVVGDALAALPRSLAGMVDVITMHPPYVPAGEVADLPAEFRISEALSTLTDGSVDGMELIRLVSTDAPRWLRRGGWLAIEVTSDVSRGVATVMRRAALRDVAVIKGRSATRAVVGRL
jgi:release factor glutamine methyltransferase